MKKFDFDPTDPLWDCLGLGICALDYLSILDPYPGLDEKIDVLASSVQGGGPVPTAMATLSKLGAKAAFAGKVGDDYEGKIIHSELAKFKVNPDYLIVDKKMKSLKAFIWVDKNSGKRTVALDRTKMSPIKPEELSFLKKVSFRYLHLDGRDIETNIYLAKKAKKDGSEVVLDVGSLRENIENLFPYVDYLVVSKKFAYDYTKLKDLSQVCLELKKIGFKCVVITLSEKGCLWTDSHKVNYFPGFKINVVDTTGAGDVFHGGFIFGLLRKWRMGNIIEFASACAALKCRKLGGREGIPTLKEVKNFLKRKKIYVEVGKPALPSRRDT
ncbi:MAG: PfkB family carbohydrate kinase [candidate division Zixibacteria bacterium]|nr:PfkB family carbohydrate kinase [candidate division Zixibacteria bacterium]